MFGTHTFYIGEKVVLIARKKKEHPRDNGVWIATLREHHATLKKELPGMRSISLLGEAPTNWQVIPETSPHFESSVIRACELIVKGDPRIGRIPKKRKAKRKS